MLCYSENECQTAFGVHANADRNCREREQARMTRY
jgi:hypothetical protein